MTLEGKRLQCWTATFESLEEAARDIMRRANIEHTLKWEKACRILYHLIIDRQYKELTEKTLINLRVQSR